MFMITTLSLFSPSCSVPFLSLSFVFCVAEEGRWRMTTVSTPFCQETRREAVEVKL